MASVTGCANASHWSADSKSACPPSASAILVSRVAIGAVEAMPAAVRQHVVEEAVGLDHPRDQAQAQRLVGLHHPARQQQVAGMGRTDDVGQQPGAGHPGVHAELVERDAEPGAGRGVPDVARQGQAQTGADGVPVDRSDRGHLQPADRQPRAVERHHPRAQLVDRGVRLAGDPAGVAARAERATRAGDHDDADRGVLGQLVDGSDPRRGHLVTHRVAHVGVVEGQQDDPLGRALEAQVREVSHGSRVLIGLTVGSAGFTLSACGA